MFGIHFRHASIPLVSTLLPRCAVNPAIGILVGALSRKIYQNCQSRSRDNNPFDARGFGLIQDSQRSNCQVS